MKKFKLKVVTTFTKHCEIEAETLEEAKAIAAENEENVRTDDFETEVFLIDPTTGDVAMTKTEWDELPYHKRAWLLGQIMFYMNNEEAYYGGWLYMWPDGETEDQCKDDFGDRESYEELEEVFVGYYSDKEYHADGLYSFKSVPSDVVKAAHMWDEFLGLEPIEILGGK